VQINLTNTDQLIIREVIVTNSNEFLRNRNYGWTYPDDPSEIIEYEGARYIRLLGKVLQYPIILNIREAQYNK